MGSPLLHLTGQATLVAYVSSVVPLLFFIIVIITEKSGVPASVEPDLPLPTQHALLQLPHKVLTLSFWTPYQSLYMQPIPQTLMTILNPAGRKATKGRQAECEAVEAI